MLPKLWGLQTYYLSWVVAVVCTVWIGTRLAQRAGYATRTAATLLFVCSVSVIVGAKLLYLAEYVLFPLDDGLPIAQTTLHALLWHGFRIPGGIVLLAVALPLGCRRLGLPTLRFADVVMPAFGVGIFCARMGCFLNGCCFSRVSGRPWAVSFPPGGPVFDWQLVHGLLAGQPTRTLPVEPLQLYFALLGLALYFLGLRWQKHQRFDGEVWLKFYLVFFAGMFGLELLAQQFLHLNLALSLIAAVAATFILLRARRFAERVAAERQIDA
jgi:phosphatidylglycerol:prolipoprotein diacylglycerol transferase